MSLISALESQDVSRSLAQDGPEDSPEYSPEQLWLRYHEIRQQSEKLAEPLSEADAQLQSMADVSPCKWHLAHTTWFFETFILCLHQPNYHRFNNAYHYLFNSYYNGIGEQYPRHQRGLISRPSLTEVFAYRHCVDENMQRLLEQTDSKEVLKLVELGLQHEQQHQELILTDIKHCLFQNPLFPAYSSESLSTFNQSTMSWIAVEPELTTIGDSGPGFSFDNERPAHKVFIDGFELASRLVTNGEYLSFIEEGGYRLPEYWLSDGWAWLKQHRQGNEDKKPLYWLQKDGQWFEFTLCGLKPLDLHQPLIHINYYEAYAYANWLGLRLPTEFEWEYLARKQPISARKQGISLHPQPRLAESSVVAELFFDTWQWTSSAYGAYPGFRTFMGAAGEYNGKFMSNQQVLRGSSCVTPQGHERLSYRNFFYPYQSWQFSGIRLAN